HLPIDRRRQVMPERPPGAVAQLCLLGQALQLGARLLIHDDFLHDHCLPRPAHLPLSSAASSQCSYSPASFALTSSTAFVVCLTLSPSLYSSGSASRSSSARSSASAPAMSASISSNLR